MLYLLFFFTSCISIPDDYFNNNDKNEGSGDGDTSIATPIYIYPFDKKVNNIEFEIIITTKNGVTIDEDKISILPLKYNKSWLFLLSQDDCMQDAYCKTWAVFNGRPYANSSKYIDINNKKYYLFYSEGQLRAGDLPPNVIL